MSLLRLDNIGKIYVSEKNVTVGIREVNLSFDSGEFVCITGKSGSGKSTLLNVISGMDSYEEGELYIGGESTSHYLQPDWEKYREDYISFIFQDYNIIDSFTVLENVELALMHIEDRGERRRRAMELIDRVGLSSHVKHKGSKLSGGQKQRTVIARALAKDSPIILADEPTGNLDSETSKEIIDLLHRVSENKLVIVVTHNFDDFSHCATRHIRIHDGAVEFDQEITPTAKQEDIPAPRGYNKPLVREIKDGITLGLSIFKAKPRLTAFLSLLMMIGTIGLFFITSLCGSAADVFKPHYMFRNIEGRLVITTKSGRVISEKELEEIATKYGAESYLRYDVLLDEGDTSIQIPSENSFDGYKYLVTDFTFGEDFGDDIIGRYPENKDEVFLYLPISYAPEFGKEELLLTELGIFNLPLRVTGVKYYYDNNLNAKCLFTEEGYRVATAASYLSSCGLSILASIEGGDEILTLYNLLPSFDIAEDKIHIVSPRYNTIISQDPEARVAVSFNATYYKYDYFGGYSDEGTGMTFRRNFFPEEVTNSTPTYYDNGWNVDALIISDETLCDIAYTVLADSYKQASLFFASTKEAHRAAELISGDEYIAVSADSTYTETAEEAILYLLESAITAVLWLLGVIFLAFFINLCSLRAVESFKNDIAIMRSMGIKVRAIRLGIYVRMALCLIPAFILLGVLSALIFTSTFNDYFTYLYAWQYCAIILGMIILTLRTTKKQIIRLFSDSVKKTIKGGDAHDQH